MTFTVKVNYALDQQKVEDLLCCAFAGGSNYWYNITEYINPMDAKVAHPHLQLPFLAKCGLMIGDIEDEDVGPWLLNLPAIDRGLSVMADKYPKHMKDLIEDNMDADTGDVFLQCCLFGEVVYG